MPIFKKFGGALAGQYHVARVPGKLVSPRVIAFRRRSQQPTAVRLERGKPSAPRPNVLDGPHGRHMVEAGVEAAFHEQRHAGGHSIVVQGGDFRAYIAGRGQVPPQPQAGPRHYRVQRRRQHGYHHISLRDQFFQ